MGSKFTVLKTCLGSEGAGQRGCPNSRVRTLMMLKEPLRNFQSKHGRCQSLP